MKLKKIILTSSFALVGMTVFVANLTTSQKATNANGSVKLSNIAFVQASAGEYHCSLTTPNCCTYPAQGGQAGFDAYGVLSYTW